MIFIRVIIFVAASLTTFSLTAQLTSNKLWVEYDSAWTFENLQLIPVRFKGENEISKELIKKGSGLITFSKALQTHKIKLQEMRFEQGADVNLLQVTNRSKQKVLVQTGEIVGGGKQDRMIAETKILEPGTTDYLQVFCIEKKRWDEKPKAFTWQGVANTELRKTMDVAARQSEVWREIDRQFVKQKKVSETSSYLDLYKDSVRTDTANTYFFTRKYAATDSNFAGYIFITGNCIISCELFSSAELTNACFYNMLSSYIHSVLNNGSAPIVTKERVKLFMNKVISSEKVQKAYVTTHGKLHIVNGEIIHLIAYDEASN